MDVTVVEVDVLDLQIAQLVNSHSSACQSQDDGPLPVVQDGDFQFGELVLS